MKIRDIYEEALIHNHYSLILLIDFVVKEKEVHKLTDDAGELDKYFLPKHQGRMNKLLQEYEAKRTKMTG